MTTPAPAASAVPPTIPLTINGKGYVLAPFNFADLPRVAELGVVIVDRVAPIKSPEGLFGALRHCSAELLELAALSATVPADEFRNLSAADGLDVVMTMFRLNETLLLNRLPKMIQTVCDLTIGARVAVLTAAELNALAMVPTKGGH